MYAKICDNCNGLAEVGERSDCIDLEFAYDMKMRHFCDEKCLKEYLNEHREYEELVHEISKKLVDILGKETIDKIKQLVNDVNNDDFQGYSKIILRERIVHWVLCEIIKDEE